MALRALLLSPDDQAIQAITSVLEEMSVSSDRPLDGATAAKKLNSEHFDLVVVDCDNLPAAKLIFDVCRRSRGATSVPVAVVDGRVGLPTAFRLGAELILTKPVAKDQARLTIRTAVSRTKKDQPTQEAKAVDAPGPVGAEKQENTVPKALAAAAGAVSGGPAQTAVAAAEPIFAAALATAKVEASPASVITEGQAGVKSSAAAEVATPVPPALSKPVLPATTRVDHSEKQRVSTPAAAVATFGQQLSEDPVMAELENDGPKQLPIPTFDEEPRPKRSRILFVATLLLAVLGGAGYAGWMYQPGFRQFIELRVEQVRTLSGWQRGTSAVRPVTPPVAANPPLAQPPAPQVVSSPTPQNSVVDAPSTTNNAVGAPLAATTNPPVAATSAKVAGASPVAAPDASSNSAATEPEKKIAEPAVPASAFPEVKNAVILSSKGAEKRLFHRVKPVVPAEVRAQSSEATVVLKALIDENGAVKALQPVEGNAAVTNAAMKAVKQWRYKPYTRDGKALPFQTIVLVDLQ